MLMLLWIAVAAAAPRPEMHARLDDFDLESTDFALPSGLRVIR